MHRGTLHRWFVQYNPLYLASACFVLAGVTLLSEEFAASGHAWVAAFGVSIVAELYALALIGAAALLVRLRKPRPAAMLGLLVVFYQFDPAMTLETSVYLNRLGIAVAALWCGLFVIKLWLLSLALRLQWSRRALALAGCSGLALIAPWLLRGWPWRADIAVMLLLFSLGSLLVWLQPRVTSRLSTDIRGHRCLAAGWAIGAALVAAHAVYWVGPAPLILASAVVAFRWAKHETTLWLVGAGLGPVPKFLAHISKPSKSLTSRSLIAITRL